MNIKPLGNRILVKPVFTDTKTESGIILPDSVSDKTDICVVVKIGESLETSYKEGDKVVCEEYSGIQFEGDGEQYRIINSDDVVGIIV